MKKFLFWILTFLWIWLSFCNAQLITTQLSATSIKNWTHDFSYLNWTDCFYSSYKNDNVSFYDSSNNLIWTLAYNTIYCNVSYFIRSDWANSNFWLYYFSSDSFWNSSTWTCEDKDITIYYNNWQSSTSIECDWVQAVEIQGLSTITSTNTFTPYFNIDYKDEDNQSLVESYSKDILYLSGSTFKKTYTWNNERILTSQSDSNSEFTWYLPTFDITWSIDPNNEFTWNVFNNFADNSLKVLLSNIPSYIQYVIIIALLFFILGFIRKFKRR